MGGSEYIIEFAVVDGTLRDVASKAGVFDTNDDGKWVTDAGPGISHPTTAFSGNGWTGIRANVDCGVADAQDGFNAAGGVCFWAAISNRRRGVVVDAEGILGNDTRLG